MNIQKTYFTNQSNKGYTMYFTDYFNAILIVFLISFSCIMGAIGLYIYNYIGG